MQLQQVDRGHGIHQLLERDQLNTSDPVRKSINTIVSVWYSFSGSTYPKVGMALLAKLT